MKYVIAGPCVIESEEICIEIAKRMKSLCEKLDLDYFFKASFDKANRSRVKSFRGPGLENGIEILKEVKESCDVNISTDVLGDRGREAGDPRRGRGPGDW